jgi:hypothetical protein
VSLLPQVADWLKEMHAGSSIISGHLERMHEKLDGLQEGVIDLKASQSDLATKFDQMFKFMRSGKGGVTKLKEDAPAELIPRCAGDD